MRTLLFLFFSVSFTFAQTDTLEALKFYPLQNGNYWEYANYWENIIPPEYDSLFYSIEVTGDTLLSNGKSYKIRSRKNIPFDGNITRIYERMDSTTACLYRFTADTSFPGNEYLCDSLLAEIDDYFAGSYLMGYFPCPEYLSTHFVNEYVDEVLNYYTTIKEFSDQSGIPAISYSFAKDIGFIYSLGCELGCSETDLKYARIDSIEYGIPILATDNFKNTLPSGFSLFQNYPNPFNPITNIAYSIPHQSLVTIKVFDVLGNEVSTLINEEKSAGRYNVKFDGRNLASGIYIYTLRAGEFIQSGKMLLLK